MSNPNARSARPASAISSKLSKSLTAYVAAAGSAGVGVLALTQAAEARVVYTPTNVAITTPLAIDLNHDGITDFTITGGPGFGHSNFLDVVPASGNGVRGAASALCGFFGDPVGPVGHFTAQNSYFGHGVFMAGFFQYSFSSFFGPWANRTNGYLGFKFLIDGQVHYGWARMSVTNHLRSVVLTGYAYETEPNTRIIDGYTSEPSVADISPADSLAPASQPASLGMLARGADALAIWRRQEEAAA